ncbi:PLP-dependent cysteine synthase family protein [Microbispora hainanensis]|jgi:cysteine synthase A|uniref:PLP-dependent cysteine synthase family protein n=1 Tax=Microbispora TaxID=2005 RepID=UPI0011573B35|nr:MULTISPECIES: PLP-dependent cysteine synthase family protein [Microbispora]NJP23928.1 PLP-dependent cysteine synthase family protein [Microbispora sp. CL1-1]TQS15446.1 PLP-dependent cysteine synthase family protein [Microbispora sp. SCL1-1]
MNHLDRHDPVTRAWVADAIQAVEADANRSCDTHLHVFPLPSHWGVDLYLKDESVHPTGSLKHRLARSLFLYGLANGWIGPTTTIIEASSGSTAVSEAYFARLLGLPFIAVIPASTSPEKREIIEFYGGKCHLVDDPRAIYDESHRLAAETGGHYMDQFTYAERATDWRGNNNIAESIFQQMELERHPEPAWIVVGAGTGGTSATIGRYIRYRRHQTRLCVADPEGSAFYPSWVSGEEHGGAGSRIEGIGRPRVEPSFLPTVIDRMTQVPDALSIAAMHWVREVTRREVGGSTGTNIAAAVQIIREMRERGERGSVVTLICDGAERYRDTYGDPHWLSERGIDITPHIEELRAFLRS